ncbi:MAG: glycosyltransferase family 2 protein [Nitrolancea sp.]
MSHRVDIIIPTYNGWAHLERCLAGLDTQLFNDFRIIVVDDASTDGTAERLRDQRPDVRVLALQRNVGLATAIDLALQISDAELVALLNNDTETEPRWLGALVAAIDRHPEAGATTSKLKLLDRKSHIHSAGDTYGRNGRPGNRGVWQPDTGQFEHEEEVFGACAGAALYRRAALDRVSEMDGDVLDRDFFMYCEDVDLSWRLRLLGYSIVYAPEAVVYHQLSATGGGPLASYCVARNTIAVIVKDIPFPLLRRNASRIVVDQLRTVFGIIPHLREPAARARLRGTFAAVPMLPRMLAKRRRIQRRSQVDLEQIERLLVP